MFVCLGVFVCLFLFWFVWLVFWFGFFFSVLKAGGLTGRIVVRILSWAAQCHGIALVPEVIFSSFQFLRMVGKKGDFFCTFYLEPTVLHTCLTSVSAVSLQMMVQSGMMFTILKWRHQVLVVQLQLHRVSQVCSQNIEKFWDWLLKAWLTPGLHKEMAARQALGCIYSANMHPFFS